MVPRPASNVPRRKSRDFPDGTRGTLNAGRSGIVAAAMLIIAAAGYAQSDPVSRSWNQPVEPFRIIGNIYYVGASDVTSFLITTPKGHILLDSGFPETVAQILQNVPKLGFRNEDIRILINSHAHFDHAGGFALLKRLTGAKLYVSEADAALLARGGLNDPMFGDKFTFEPVKTDQLVRAKEPISLGGVEITPLITPGHTKGCTTWTMRAANHNVVFVCSATSPGYQLVGNAKYPDVIADFRRTFGILNSLEPDVFLAPHGSFFGLLQKIAAMKRNPSVNPFIERKRYRTWVAEVEADFEKKVAEQTAAARR